MSPWYWVPIALAVLGAAQWAVLVYWDEDRSYWFGGLLLLGAFVWANWLWISHEPASWNSPALKHDVPTWVCVGWSEQ